MELSAPSTHCRKSWPTNPNLVLIFPRYLGLKNAMKDTVLLPTRQLFDDSGNHVCHTGREACVFYTPARLPGLSGSCKHAQRGIPDNKPHRLCWFLEHLQ
jgi:hypothetical protein